MRPVALVALLLLASGSTAYAYVTPGPLFQANGYAFSAGASDRAAFADLNRDGLDDLVLGDWHGYAVALATGAGSFGPFEHRLTHLGSTSPVVADFDGDGLLDVGGGSKEGVFVQYGDGNAGVAASFELPIAEGLGFVYAGDLDGDGRADLVTSDYNTASLSVYLANADRTMSAGTTIALPGGARHIAIGDVVGSPAADIVVAYGELSEVDILPGVGDGTFGPAIVLPVSTAIDAIALGTMDAGTSLDLMLRSSPAEGILFGSNQGGSFAPFESLPSPDGGFDVLVGDYNGDGKLDALSDVFFSGRSRLQTWLGDGAGGFGPRIDSGDVLYKLFGKVQGDVDGDGDLDVAGFNPTFYELILILGNGDGTFGGCPPAPAMVAGRLRGSAAGDFDGDGKLDAVGSNDLTNKLAFARGDGDGTFDPIVESAALPAGYTFLASGHFDADEKLDLVAVGATFAFFHGQGDGTFAPPIDYALGAGPGEPLVVDLDGNGKLDVVVPCAGANALYQFLQGPSGLAAPTISPTPAGPASVRYADFNADGRLDRVVACTNLVVSQLDNGIGGYSTVMSQALSQPANALELGDLDEDGKVDLVYNEYLTNFQASARSPFLHVFKGQGAGIFDSETIVSADFDPGAFSLMSHRSLNRFRCLDLDEDGHLDLVGPDQGLFQFDVLRGNGDRTFKPAESFLGPMLRYSASYADFNGDGHVDILTTGDRLGQTSFTVFLNRTGGVVGVPPSATRPTAAIALAPPYPNPARSSFTLRFRVPSREPVTVDVVSVAGRRVLSRRMEPVGAGEQSLRLDGLSGLSAGVYAVLVSQGEHRASTRLVVLP